jgi:hypothetical protein
VGAGYERETLAEADCVVSAWLTAVTVTKAGFGTGSGAV